MSEQTPDQNLHLPSLVIKNFRGIDELTIPRLGRATLLAGKNGVGKTTVLDAVRVWAGRGQRSVIDEVLRTRGDAFADDATVHGRVAADYASLFTNRLHGSPKVISISPGPEHATLYVRRRSQDKTSDPPDPGATGAGNPVALEANFGGGLFLTVEVIAESSRMLAPHKAEAVCNALGPNAPTDQTVEEYWNEIALSYYEDRAVEALNLVTSSQVERVAMVSPATTDGVAYRRRMMAKVSGKEYPLPLRSLGDGALRCFAVALALAKSSDGFLLIDEAENGIHHSIRAKFWNMVLQTAERNNVQVIATTHSWDCVVGFAKAANQLENVEGVLYRIQRNGERLRAVEYRETELANAAKHRIEVR